MATHPLHLTIKLLASPVSKPPKTPKFCAQDSEKEIYKENEVFGEEIWPNSSLGSRVSAKISQIDRFSSAYF